MKLVEAMNELKLTEKKLRQHTDFIRKYAARPSHRDDAFDTKANGEAKKVAERLQSANDLITRHEKLKRDIDYTNLTTLVDVPSGNGKPKKMPIHSLILHKRFLCKLKRNVLTALDDRDATLEVQQMKMRERDNSKINSQVVYNYDIQEKEDGLLSLAELESNIDSALQIANAKVDLQECPEKK